MRKLLAIFFLTVFTFQVIPMKAIGKLLKASDNTEEVQDDSADSPDGKVTKNWNDVFFAHEPTNQFASRIGFNKQVTAFILKSESLPSVHVAEMPSPPPDIEAVC